MPCRQRSAAPRHPPPTVHQPPATVKLSRGENLQYHAAPKQVLQQASPTCAIFSPLLPSIFFTSASSTDSSCSPPGSWACGGEGGEAGIGRSSESEGNGAVCMGVAEGQDASW